jgi:hypothetical protein
LDCGCWWIVNVRAKVIGRCQWMAFKKMAFKKMAFKKMAFKKMAFKKMAFKKEIFLFTNIFMQSTPEKNTLSSKKNIELKF